MRSYTILQSRIYRSSLSSVVLRPFIAICACFYKGFAKFSIGSNGFSTIVYIVEDGDRAEVKTLINDGADVNAKDEYGDTALMAAAENGYTEIVESLKASDAK